VRRREFDPWYKLVATVIKPLLLAFTIKDWHGAENLPPEGGLVVVTNHISHLDPFTFGHFMYDNGFLPRFLTKEAMFRAPIVGRVVRGAQQIPVYRETADANASYAAAVDAVRRGECIAVYPEGTLTRDPDLWPMRGKTGAARIALATGCPVLPVVQWGAHEILPPYTHRPHLLPRHVIHVWAGKPIDLSPWAGKPLSGAVVTQATAAVTATMTSMLEEIRGEKAPAAVWDPREHAQPVIGNPHARPDSGQRR
jgi:1-acyl-sn-glycerol-3-phosphate acyltransferase